MQSYPNYKNKYLKYKLKYQELKNKINYLISENSQINNFRIKLKQLYPKAVYDLNMTSSQNQYYGSNVITYGELEYDGLEIINNILNPNKEVNYFFDIGSGRGKLVLYEASEPNIIKSYGIELVKQRHDDAVKLLNNIKENDNFDEFTNKVNFIFGDIFDIDLGKMIEPNSKVLVWISNLCFSKNINEKIFDKITNELPKGTLIACSQSSENLKLEKLPNIIVPMSWTSNSDVNVYKIK